MSGGSLDYFYNSLEEHVGDFGDKELDELVKDLAELFHDREWYLSSDTGIGEWTESMDNFKAKWFTKSGRQKRIEKYLEDLKREVMASFGFEKEYCISCKHWRRWEKSDRYGACEFQDCSMHRSEWCKKWEKKDG